MTISCENACAAAIQDRRMERLLIWGVVLLYALVWLRTAWVCDDAYITMRTVDNFMHGFGLRWNPGERVQSYTHPLWMLCLLFCFAIVRNAYIAMLGLSFLFSMATVTIVAFRLARSTASAILAVALLTLSKAFMDYSSSGLENPLTHLLFALFVWLYLSGKTSPRALFALSALVALAILNRMDALLLFAPALGWRLWQTQNRRALSHACLGFLPFAIWEIFSLIYYGFLFPNTAYAKLNTGIQSWELFQQGCGYLLYALDSDPITPLFIIFTIGAACLIRKTIPLAIAVGVALYLLYTLKIGGDFMAGRFLAAPLLGAAILVSRIEMRADKPAWLAALAAMCLVGFLAPEPTLLCGAQYGMGTKQIEKISPSGIADERSYYYERTGLLRFRRNEAWPYVTPARLNPQPGNNGIIVENNTGFLGFYGAKQTLSILDDYALCDPLMARLPVRDKWRIGHFRRRIPEGYPETLGAGENRIVHPELHAYYDALCILTKAPLFSVMRLGTIIKMNLGGYGDLLDAYIATMPPYDPNRNIGKN